jgi:acetoin utilization deacetylase AcuC-like enzyme
MCSGRMLLVLEGGYHQESLGESVADSFQGLLQEPVLDTFDARLLREEPIDKVKSLIAQARRLHSL